MSNEKIICPADSQVCDMKEEDKHGQGCWLCPKIQSLRDAPYDKPREEECNFGREEKE